MKRKPKDPEPPCGCAKLVRGPWPPEVLARWRREGELAWERILREVAEPPMPDVEGAHLAQVRREEESAYQV